MQSNGFGVCLQRARTSHGHHDHRKQVCRVGKSAALAANEQGLKPNLAYYREGWNNKLQNLTFSLSLAE